MDPSLNANRPVASSSPNVRHFGVEDYVKRFPVSRRESWESGPIQAELPLPTDFAFMGFEDRDQLVEWLRSALEAHLAQIELHHFDGTGALNGFQKHLIRASHRLQREVIHARDLTALQPYLGDLLENFAVGSEVAPDRIDPELVLVDSENETGRLFRFATLLWSVPVSRGFGRRMRFLVRDKQNGKLIGIFALGDPVFNLKARDQWIGWNVDDRRARLVNVMDAFVVGSVPPYSLILGGKLVVSLMGATEVTDCFRDRYSNSVGEISGESKSPRLVLVTVTSALGRSSLYNRVVLPGKLELHRIGGTQGWGHFQIPEPVFQGMRLLLDIDGHKYASGNRFGQGPNWRMRVIREALNRIGIQEDLLRHGITREVFAMPLASNFREFLMGGAEEPLMTNLSVSEISRAAIERWVVPRSLRQEEYKLWTLSSTAELFGVRRW